MSTTTQPMTAEQFLALPADDGVDRQLIRGECREKPMTYRNRSHARTEARVTHYLMSWLEKQSAPHGEVLSGEAGCILPSDPETVAGIDVAYFSIETMASQTEATAIVRGVPILAVEVLSPSDKQESIDEKVALYLECGVGQVWIVNPRLCTITVYRSDNEHVLFNLHQTLTGDPHLPGFAIPLSTIFNAG